MCAETEVTDLQQCVCVVVIENTRAATVRGGILQYLYVQRLYSNIVRL